jgi:hypothetical protein
VALCLLACWQGLAEQAVAPGLPPYTSAVTKER